MHAEVGHGAHAWCEVFVRRRVHHHRGVDARERTALEHEHFSAAALLGRRADDADAQVEVVDERRERKPRAYRGGRDDVVTARGPIPGNASYSAQIARCNEPLPI